MIRRSVRYTGHVQGVGFRATAHHLARGFPVTGYVRNRPDGSVELVAEGEPADVSAFLKALADRMANRIDHADVHPGDATGEFAGFDIRY